MGFVIFKEFLYCYQIVMKKILPTIFIAFLSATFSYSADSKSQLNVSCRPPFNQNIERLDIVKLNGQFLVSFDFKVVSDFTCLDSTTDSSFTGIVKCSDPTGKLIQINTTETGFSDGVLIMDEDHKSGILCFLIQ